MGARIFLRAAMLAVVVVFGLPSVVHAATFVVSNINDSGSGSLRGAVIRANNNSGADSITFAVGVTGRIVLTSGQLLITDDLTISGPGASVLTVSGNQSSRVFDVESNTTVAIAGLTITEGVSIVPEHTIGGGGGIRNFGSLTLDDSVVTDNRVEGAPFESRGGGIYNNGFLTVTNSAITDNTTSGFGGAISSDFGGGLLDTSVTVVNTNVIGNYAGDGGGGIQNSGSPLVIEQSTIRANFSAVRGSSIISGQAPVTIIGSTVSENEGGDITPEGGITIAEGSAFIEDSRVVGNAGSVGIEFTGLAPQSHLLVVRNSLISGNSGGGIYNDEGTVILRNNTRVRNNSGSGIVNVNPGVLRVRSSTISDNTAEQGGGILNRPQATARLFSSTVVNNTAVSGGGVYNQGALTLASSSITSNSATGGPGSGGGVFNDGGTVSLHANSTISNNIPDDCVGC